MRQTLLARLVALVGLVGLAGMGLLNVASGLVAPFWAVILLVAVWAGLVFLGLRWFSAHPWRVLLLPVISYLVWFIVLNTGGAWLGWTA